MHFDGSNLPRVSLGRARADDADCNSRCRSSDRPREHRRTGFGASEEVAIYFDTADLVLAVTDAEGAFSGVSANIPDSATPGTHTIAGIGRISGLRAQTTFTVRADAHGCFGAALLGVSDRRFEFVPCLFTK